MEWYATPSDLYQMAIEVAHEWDEGRREATAALNKAAELKQKTKGKQ